MGIEDAGRLGRASTGTRCSVPSPPVAPVRKAPQSSVFPPLFAGDEQSWCKRETCLCDTAVASCFASTLHSYNNSYRFYFKLKCQGSKLQC